MLYPTAKGNQNMHCNVTLLLNGATVTLHYYSVLFIVVGIQYIYYTMFLIDAYSDLS